ncbi:hypothetical protein [uncultured Dubosiella sp.]|uniref:hypothetical protein n=1 Tax=uncultured Dubosiella sp. TaxID=1937011 RepID=UPI00272EF98C|nr:hypothetical protein [uncultured Dubosiella sp.]
MNAPNRIIEPWMIGSLRCHGNTIIGEAKMKRHGKQAYIEAFASCGFAVRIRESENTEGCRVKMNKKCTNTSLRDAKVKHYVVEMIRK